MTTDPEAELVFEADEAVVGPAALDDEAELAAEEVEVESMAELVLEGTTDVDVALDEESTVRLAVLESWATASAANAAKIRERIVNECLPPERAVERMTASERGRTNV